MLRALWDRESAATPTAPERLQPGVLAIRVTPRMYRCGCPADGTSASANSSRASLVRSPAQQFPTHLNAEPSNQYHHCQELRVAATVHQYCRLCSATWMIRHHLTLPGPLYDSCSWMPCTVMSSEPFRNTRMEGNPVMWCSRQSSTSLVQSTCKQAVAQVQVDPIRWDQNLSPVPVKGLVRRADDTIS